MQNPSVARARFGELADTLFAALNRTDPLADAAVGALEGAHTGALDAALRGDLEGAPPELRRLIEAATVIPAWVERERAERAGRLFFRSGPAGGITLGAKSLIAGYCSPAGNKPLAFSGQLETQVTRRLGETSRFVVLTCTPGMLAPFAEGWQVTLRVRLMHARVRRLLEGSKRWQPEEWGAPINQHDMAATNLLFSVVFLDGLRDFGVPFRASEADDFVHLWRWSGWLMGVEEALLPRDEAGGQRLAELIEITQAPPDDDSRRLAHALLESPKGHQASQGKLTTLQVALGHGFCRALLGDRIADQLHVPRVPTRHVVPAVRLALRAAQRLTPKPLRARAASWAVSRGEGYWARNVAISMGGAPPRFALPSSLRRVSLRAAGTAP